MIPVQTEMPAIQGNLSVKAANTDASCDIGIFAVWIKGLLADMIPVAQQVDTICKQTTGKPPVTCMAIQQPPSEKQPENKGIFAESPENASPGIIETIIREIITLNGSNMNGSIIQKQEDAETDEDKSVAGAEVMDALPVNTILSNYISESELNRPDNAETFEEVVYSAKEQSVSPDNKKSINEKTGETKTSLVQAMLPLSENKNTGDKDIPVEIKQEVRITGIEENNIRLLQISGNKLMCHSEQSGKSFINTEIQDSSSQRQSESGVTKQDISWNLNMSSFVYSEPSTTSAQNQKIIETVIQEKIKPEYFTTENNVAKTETAEPLRVFIKPETVKTELPHEENKIRIDVVNEAGIKDKPGTETGALFKHIVNSTNAGAEDTANPEDIKVMAVTQHDNQPKGTIKVIHTITEEQTEKSAPALSGLEHNRDKHNEAKPSDATSSADNGIMSADRTKVVQQKPETPETQHIFREAVVITKKEGNSIELSLKPEGLGKLEIQLSLDKGVIHARIDASENTGRDLISRNIGEIMKTLSAEGINIGSFSVNLKERRSEQAEYKNEVKTYENSAEEKSLPAVSAGSGLINIFA